MRRETGDMKPIKSYKDLRIWQEGIDLVDSIYKLTTQQIEHHVERPVASVRNKTLAFLRSLK